MATTNLIIVRLYLIIFLFFLIGCKKDSAVIKKNNSEPPALTNTSADSVPSPVIGIEIGNKAPEISLRDSSGNIVALSSLKNKIVLIDFWASWCKPCIMENRNLKVTYPQFTDTTFKNASGFEIFSVSTDAIRLMWVNNLNYEQYNWRYHVRDTSSTYSQLYKIVGIPANFLINGEGIIIAKNLRGVMVEDTLKTLLNK